MFAGHFHVHFDHHIGVQSHVHSSGRDGFDRAVGHAHLGFGHSEASFGQCFSDVGVGDGAKQAAIDTGFLRQLDGVTAQLFAFGLGGCQLFSGLLFQFSAFGVEFCFGSFGSAAGFASGDQEVAGVAVLDLDDIARLPRFSTFSSRMICMRATP